MTEYLTPAELDAWADELERNISDHSQFPATLRELAAIVAAVAKMERYEVLDHTYNACNFCGQEIEDARQYQYLDLHEPNCPYIRAREVMGNE